MPHRIDTHQHLVPPRHRVWLDRHGQTAGGRGIPEWSVDAALEVLEANAVATAVVSVSTPGAHLGDDGEAREQAREVNEFAAQLCRDDDRFGFFATLTLPDVEGSLAEAAHALDTLGADGVILLANSRGRYLGDPEFRPLLAELERRRCPIFVHPHELPDEPVPGVPPFAADFLLDTTRTALSLAQSGALDELPDLTVILSHAGGFLPYAAYRCAPLVAGGDAARGLELLSRFWFDLALSASPTVLPGLLEFAGPGRILYGTDWPYAPPHAVAGFTAALDRYPLDDDARHAIDRGNAEALFPRLASTPVSSTTGAHR